MTVILDLRNMARLGLFQICIVVGGVLGAAVTARLWNEFGLQGLPWYTPLLRNYGFWLLLIPLGGVIAAFAIRERESGELYGYSGGWIALIGLSTLVLGANIIPWLRLCLFQLSP